MFRHFGSLVFQETVNGMAKAPPSHPGDGVGGRSQEAPGYDEAPQDAGSPKTAQ